MELTDALRKRSSIKNFTLEPVSENRLTALIDLARYSPSANNTNPWRFVIVTERKTLDRLAQTHPYCRWLESAPAGIALTADPGSTRYWLEDCCIAAFSIWLAATELGLGIGWAAMFQSDNPSESERRQAFVRQTLAIPGEISVPIVLGIGHPASSPPEKERPSVREIAFWEQYPTGGH